MNFRISEGISGVEVKLGALEALTKYYFFIILTFRLVLMFFVIFFMFRIDQAMEELRKSK